ncbi:MAG TPA: hypothetical protein VFC19_48245 [Candidatus Limnocylindrales bacterium]|nr:hypothetical protein [Candidatus Limnocylindrales bacterium]
MASKTRRMLTAASEAKVDAYLADLAAEPTSAAGNCWYATDITSHMK